MYSFAPALRIFNGELQAVSGIGELAALYRDRRANRLFRRGERGARAMVAASDTGAWSLYSFAGREATLSYHQLIEEFLGDMCTRTDRRVYCDAERRFARYEREPTRIGDRAAAAPACQAHATSVRFSISKISTVRVRLYDREGLTFSRDLELPHGAHESAGRRPRAGGSGCGSRPRARAARSASKAQTFRVVLPKPKPKKPKKHRLSARAELTVSAACRILLVQDGTRQVILSPASSTSRPPRACARLDATARRRPRLLVDLTDVDFCDSTGLRALLGARRGPRPRRALRDRLPPAATSRGCSTSSAPASGWRSTPTRERLAALG